MKHIQVQGGSFKWHHPSLTSGASRLRQKPEAGRSIVLSLCSGLCSGRTAIAHRQCFTAIRSPGLASEQVPHSRTGYSGLHHEL